MKKLIRMSALFLLIAVMAMIYPATGFSKPGGGGGGSTTPPKNAFNIMMNYELGMHCTGFEFSYCCILPPYNSILAQVVKTEKAGGKPKLMQADPNVGIDGLGRPTVVRDTALDGSGNFKKYMLRYWHDAQPRNDGRGAPQTSTLISQVEGNSMLMWNTVFDSAALDANGALIYGTKNGASGVVLGDGDTSDFTDNYANAWMNHLYIYADLEGSNPNNSSLEKDKIRLGVTGHVEYPENVGAALHPMGPIDPNDPSQGTSGGPFDNVLTFSGDTGTVVFTQMKVLENLPIMLTSPRIWEALGLPLTPFEDSINFFGDPGAIDEDSIRPYVQMRARLVDYTTGSAVLDGGKPVEGLGTAPIDIPNCERCHSLGAGPVNSAQTAHPDIAVMVQGEIDFWNGYYDIDTGAGDSDWYSRLKGAAISILAIHDAEHGTSFLAGYPGTGSGLPQNTRLGGETVVCQRCHADNVIAVVKSANCGPAQGDCEAGNLIPPMTEAIHNNHKDNPFSDSLGRNGGCQGCHPAHRSDGSLAGYPITETGDNAYAAGDNRDASGGCFVGRDVHSNRNKDNDGAGTPSHLNAVGQWLVTNVANDTGTWKGIWCTNCHSQLGQELWKAENVPDLVHANPGDPGHVREPFAGAALSDVASGLGISTSQAIAWLDPKNNADTAAVWKEDPGLCNYVAGYFGVIPVDPGHDGNVATVEVQVNSASSCTTGGGTGLIDCGAAYPGAPAFYICGSTDADGDFSVSALDFCTTPDCVAAAQASLPAGSVAVPVPFSAATDGRDHWLSAGEPHCADCHAAPYVEQSGNITAYPPFNYPKKASLFRYTRGHQDISCQGCHESIHGLYPVTPDIDTTTYAQAAGMNTDGSHGPLKCGACHKVNSAGVPSFIQNIKYKGTSIKNNFDAAVSWSHTFTAESDPTTNLCVNCHGDNSSKVSCSNSEWLKHSMDGRVSREQMDKVETKKYGAVCGSTNPQTTVCTKCHGSEWSEVSCSENEWLNHLVQGRVSESVWEAVSTTRTGGTCGY
ncbi:MAG: hypothetical protein AABY87_04095 [bacterium]